MQHPLSALSCLHNNSKNMHPSSMVLIVEVHCLALPWSLFKVQLSLPVTVSHVKSGRQARRSHHSGGDAIVAWPEEDLDSHLLWQLRLLVAAGPAISKIHCSFGSGSRSPMSELCSPSDSGGGKAILPCTKALPT